MGGPNGSVPSESDGDSRGGGGESGAGAGAGSEENGKTGYQSNSRLSTPLTPFTFSITLITLLRC